MEFDIQVTGFCISPGLLLRRTFLLQQFYSTCCTNHPGYGFFFGYLKSSAIAPTSPRSRVLLIVVRGETRLGNKAKFNCRQYPYVITLDIKSYFDTIPHAGLLKALQFYCKEKWVSLYVSRWLKASVVNEDGSKTQPQSGTPQGGVISPLLANLYLHVVFDGWMQQHYPGIRFERYADDIIIHARREQIAKSILQSCRYASLNAD
jgi:hypothetical protein